MSYNSIESIQFDQSLDHRPASNQSVEVPNTSQVVNKEHGQQLNLTNQNATLQ
jgi:hypothetical protein